VFIKSRQAQELVRHVCAPVDGAGDPLHREALFCGAPVVSATCA
jgi:hypothetical protein